jgi:hypothetical protein
MDDAVPVLGAAMKVKFTSFSCSLWPEALRYTLNEIEVITSWLTAL